MGIFWWLGRSSTGFDNKAQPFLAADWGSFLVEKWFYSGLWADILLTSILLNGLLLDQVIIGHRLSLSKPEPINLPCFPDFVRSLWPVAYAGMEVGNFWKSLGFFDDAPFAKGLNTVAAPAVMVCLEFSKHHLSQLC